MNTEDIRAAAERLIREATLHKAEYPDRVDLPELADDILIIGPAALAGLDMQAALAARAELVAEVERLTAERNQALSERDTWSDVANGFMHERNAARQEVERLKRHAAELRKMIVDSANVCTLKGCKHCKWLGFNLGRYESLVALGESPKK